MKIDFLVFAFIFRNTSGYRIGQKQSKLTYISIFQKMIQTDSDIDIFILKHQWMT